MTQQEALKEIVKAVCEQSRGRESELPFGRDISEEGQKKHLQELNKLSSLELSNWLIENRDTLITLPYISLKIYYTALPLFEAMTQQQQQQQQQMIVLNNPMNIHDLKDVRKWKIKDTDMVVEILSQVAITPTLITNKEDNVIEVFISSTSAGCWYEDWNLSHTIVGFQQGLYIPII